MWLPTMEYFYFDIAKGDSRSSGSVFGKDLWQRLLSLPFLLSFLMPQLLGSVRALDMAKLINSHLQDFSAFVGTAPLLFGLCGLFNFRALQARMKPFLLLAVLGVAVPIFTPLDRYFYFRFLIVYLLGICVLGALSLERFLTAPTKADSRIQNGFFATCGLIFLGISAVNLAIWWKGDLLYQKLHDYIARNIASSTIGSRNPEWMLERVGKTFAHFSLGSPTMAVPLLLALLLFLVVLGHRRGFIGRSVFLFSLWGITVLELGFFAKSWFPTNDLRAYPLFPKTAVTDFLAVNAQDYRVLVNDFHGSSEPKREKQILPTNTNVIYGYKSIAGFDGMMPAVVYHIPFGYDDYRGLGIRNVKYILTNPRPRLKHPDLELVQDGEVAVYENKLAKPRGRILYDYEVAPDSVARERLASRDYDGSKVYFPAEPPIRINDGTSPNDDVAIISQGDNHIAYSVKTDRAGYFVTSETFYPGWEAKLNGAPVEILRANYIMRAVIVPPGEHRIEFRFEPVIYRVGLFLSILGLVCLAALWIGGFGLVSKLVGNR
jgi:hypothetical protein